MQLPQNPIIIYDGILQAGVVVTSLSFVGATIGGFPGGAQVTVGGGGGGANTALSNLAVTAVNADIQPAGAFTLNMGSSALPWSSVNSLQTNYLYTRLYQQGVPSLVGAILGWESTYYVASQSIPSTAIFATESAKIISQVYDDFALFSANDPGIATDVPTKNLHFETGNKINGTLTNVVGTGAVRLRTGSITVGTIGTTGAISILSGNKVLGNAASGGTGPIGLRSGDIGVNPSAAVVTTTATGGLSIGTGTNFYNVAALNNTGGMTIKSGDIGASSGGPWLNGGTTGGINFSTGINYSTTMVGTVAQNRTGGITFTSGAASFTTLAATDVITGGVAIRSGNAASGTSGNVSVGSGNGALGASGSVFLFSGTANSANASGGVTVSSGNQSGTGASGAVQMFSGFANSGTSGLIGIGSGQSTSGSTGTATFTTGIVSSGAGSSGQMSLNTGATVDGNSGNLFLRTGQPTGTGNSGDIFIITGDFAIGAYTGVSGQVVIQSGDSNQTDTGDVYLKSGTCANGTTGDAYLHTGAATGGISGTIRIYSGNTIGANSGDIFIDTGTSTATRGKISMSASLIDFNNTPISNAPSFDVPLPTTGNKVANKNYVDGVVLGSSVMRDQQTSGTNGDTILATTWTDRTVNTLEDPAGIIKNPAAFTGTGGVNAQFDLAAGTYYISASIVSSDNQHIAKLVNITDATDVINGNVGLTSQIEGIFTIAAAKSFKIQSYDSFATTGGTAFGLAGRPEIYSCVTIQKIG